MKDMNTNRFINVNMKFHAVLPERSPSTFKATNIYFSDTFFNFLFMQFIETFSKMSLNKIFKTNMVILLFLLIFGTSHLASVEDDIVNFLEDQGLQELSAGFVSEEIEVWQLPSIPDNFLVQLGVTTMGARLRLRSAATTWLTQERGQVQDTGSGQVCAVIFVPYLRLCRDRGTFSSGGC